MHSRRLLGRQYDAQVISVTDDSVYKVILYDSDARVNMNEWILSQVVSHLPAKPLKEGGPNEKAFITHVSSASGDVFIRRPDTASTRLVDSLVSLLTARCVFAFIF